MKLTHILFLGLSTATIALDVKVVPISTPPSPAVEAEDLKIDIYDGPTECPDANRVKPFDQVAVHYTGTIDQSSATGTPGSQFDSSRDRNTPYELMIGIGRVIDGWDKGLTGLCAGARAVLVVPPAMAYGPAGAGDVIPPDATLRFDVEVLSVSPPPPQPDLFLRLDMDGDGALTEGEIEAHFRGEDPEAVMPPGLMAQDDADGDGVVSREEFGGPRMPRDMCLEMLFRDSEPRLAVQWLCLRPGLLPEPEVGEGTMEGEL